MKVIIGLAGVKTSGKSTVAGIIRKFVDAKESALADNLKNVSAAVFGLERVHFDHQSLKELQFKEPMYFTARKISRIFESFNITGYSEREIDTKLGKVMEIPLDSPRKIAQIVGTELLREYGGIDIHCNNVDVSSEGVTIISDVRFPNEYSFFQREDVSNDNVTFIPLYIQRDEAESHVDMEKSHASETSVFTFCEKCIKVDNNGSLGETEAQIINILRDNGLIWEE